MLAALLQNPNDYNNILLWARFAWGSFSFAILRSGEFTTPATTFDLAACHTRRNGHNIVPIMHIQLLTSKICAITDSLKWILLRWVKANSECIVRDMEVCEDISDSELDRSNLQQGYGWTKTFVFLEARNGKMAQARLFSS